MSSATSWKLADGISEHTQSIVTTGFSTLGEGVALFLELPGNCGGDWLKALMDKAPVTAAADVGKEDDPLSQAISISFTSTGLTQMGVSEEAMATFLAPFREGMFQEDRLRRLGDRRSGEWLDTVIDGGPIWSGNTPVKAPEKPEHAHQETTEITVHAMVLAYHGTLEEVQAFTDSVEELLAEHGVKIAHSLQLVLDVIESKGFSREHFGFADGLSQPIPFDEIGAVLSKDEKSMEPDRHNGVPLGEFLIGYKNGHQEFAPGPVVADRKGGQLNQHPQAEGYYDFGKNGSYVVVRQLRQNVAAFWNGLDAAAEKALKQDPKAKHITADWLAEKIVGRTKEGHVLHPDGRLPPGPKGRPRNDFDYFDDDRHGHGCPLGSHVRRSNPRDSLAPKESQKQSLLDAANNHRILRRGRKYGTKVADPRVDDGEDRGLLFICLNTDIARQFEFTQHTWLLNSDFSTLFEETDPLVGPDGMMTIPEDPLRRRIAVQTFVQMVGGEYFFLPSLPALNYLAAL